MSEKMKCALIDQIIQSGTELSVREALSVSRLLTWRCHCGDFPHIASILPTDAAALTVIRPKYHTSDRDVRSTYGSERARKVLRHKSNCCVLTRCQYKPQSEWREGRGTDFKRKAFVTRRRHRVSSSTFSLHHPSVLFNIPWKIIIPLYIS